VQARRLPAGLQAKPQALLFVDDLLLRVGLTAGRVLGKAVERNRIKRRMREVVRANLTLLTHNVDVVLHPRRSVLTAEFIGLRTEVEKIFATVEKAAVKKAGAMGVPNV
jgi:ribonuclease P protein component